MPIWRGMVDTTDAWITERTGIKERHILKGEGLGTSHMARGGRARAAARKPVRSPRTSIC